MKFAIAWFGCLLVLGGGYLILSWDYHCRAMRQLAIADDGLKGPLKPSMIRANPISNSEGQELFYTVYVTSPQGGVPTGKVTLMKGPDILASGTLTTIDGAATVALTVPGGALNAGSHDLVFTYRDMSAKPIYDNSSKNVVQSVATIEVVVPDGGKNGKSPPDDPTTPLKASNVNVAAVNNTFGQELAYTVTVTSPQGGVPIGKVTLTKDEQTLASSTLSNVDGVAKVVIALAAGTLKVGSHKLVFTFEDTAAKPIYAGSSKNVVQYVATGEKLNGDLLVVMIETAELRKNSETFKTIADQLVEFQQKNVGLELNRQLLGGKIFVTRKNGFVPWNGDAPGGEAFGHGEFHEAFRRVFEDAETLIARAKNPTSVKVVLVWCSNFNPDSLESITLRKPAPVLGLIWIDHQRSKKMDTLFDRCITPVTRNDIAGLSASMGFSVGIWLNRK